MTENRRRDEMSERPIRAASFEEIIAANHECEQKRRAARLRARTIRERREHINRRTGPRIRTARLHEE